MITTMFRPLKIRRIRRLLSTKLNNNRTTQIRTKGRTSSILKRIQLLLFSSLTTTRRIRNNLTNRRTRRIRISILIVFSFSSILKTMALKINIRSRHGLNFNQISFRMFRGLRQNSNQRVISGSTILGTNSFRRT